MTRIKIKRTALERQAESKPDGWLADVLSKSLSADSDWVRFSPAALREINPDHPIFKNSVAPKPMEPGPGTELTKLFSKLGFHDSVSCQCRRHAEEMNRRGVEWCRENIDTIIFWLREECARRKIPFVEFAARIVVNLAIDRAEIPDKVAGV